MPLVTMRQLLDEAAAGGYGVAAFNVNNMEQIQGIMEAAQETQSPVIVQASRGARKYAGDRFLYHMMLAAAETYPDIPVALHQDHGNSPGDLHQRDRARLHERHDGRLARRGRQDAAGLRGQRRRHEEGRRLRARARRHGRGRARHARRHRGRRRLRRDLPDRPGPGRGVRRAHRRRRAGRRDRHEPRRVQVLARARRRHPRDGDHRGHPPPPARHAHRHARLLERPGRHRRAREGRRRRGRRRLRRADLARSSAASSTACARSTSTPTGASRSPRSCASTSRTSRATGIRAVPARRRAPGQKLICVQRMQELGMAGHAGDYEPLSLEQMAERYAAGVRTTV